MSTNERLIGADDTLCLGCLGISANHADCCERIPVSTHASLLSDEEVERLENEGKSS